MSTTEPIAKRGRGRPRKVIEDTVEEVTKTGTRKASTNATKASPKAPKSVKGDEVVKKSPKAATSKSAKSTTKKAELKPTKTTPVAPSSSKILQEVAAKGTLKVGSSTATVAPAKASPPAQPSTPTPEPTTTAASKPPSTTTAASKPTMAVPSKLPPPRATTIPLPTKPLDPSKPQSRPLPYRAPPPSTPPPPPRNIPVSPSAQAAAKASPNQKPEWTPDSTLPPKYKPAARRVTAIIVGIPILFVTSYELYRRWDNQIRHTFETRDMASGKGSGDLIEASPSPPPLPKISDSVVGRPEGVLGERSGN